MRATDRSILFGLLILGVIACFWFLVLSPKRERASELETQANDLRDQVAQQEQLAVAAEQGQAEYAENYERLIVLGKAAPADGDTPSLLAQLSSHADKSGTEFQGLAVAGDSGGTPAPAAAPPPTDSSAAAAPSSSATPAASTTPAPATEASAALLPLGATVGPAGLGVLPYALQFQGDFFQVADLLERLDSQVGADSRRTSVDGRLVTINGFSVAPAEGRDLSVDLSITTYVLPDSQGLTAGATPTAPPAAVPPATAVPTSTTTTP